MTKNLSAVPESNTTSELSIPVRSESPIVITGMHRSATSFAASLLHYSGISVGDELVAPDAGNQRGHFEDVRFQGFHREVLLENALSEHGWILDQQVEVSESQKQAALEIVRRAAGHPVWGWKDPRTTLFLDFWGEVVPHARYIFLYRAAWDVADSLFRRNAPHDRIFSEAPESAIEVWTHYNQRILRFFDAHAGACLLVNADSLIRDPGKFQQLIRDRFGIPMSGNALDACDPDLYHSQLRGTLIPEVVCRQFPAVSRVWAELERRSAFPASDTMPCPEVSSTILSGLAPTNLREWINWRRPAGPQ